MKETLQRVLSWTWITLHSAAYLVLAGVMLRFFGVTGMVLWFAGGWLLLTPSLVLPSLLWRKYTAPQSAPQPVAQTSERVQ